MDIKLNIPDWLKIPINILLPAVWLFSAAFTFLPDALLAKLHLLEWCEENGFAIGLTFLITSCLLIIYLLYFLITISIKLINKLTRNRRTIKHFGEMNDAEKAVIVMLYNQPDFTGQVDFNQPIIKALLAKNYIYGGGTQRVVGYIGSTALPIYVTLQPFVYQALDWAKPKIQDRIKMFTRKLEKETNPEKKQELSELLQNMREGYDYIYGGSN